MLNNRDWKKELEEDEEREWLAMKKRVWYMVSQGLVFLFSIYGVYAFVVLSLYLFKLVTPEELKSPILFYRVGFCTATGWVLCSFMDNK